MKFDCGLGASWYSLKGVSLVAEEYLFDRDGACRKVESRERPRKMVFIFPITVR